MKRFFLLLLCAWGSHVFGQLPVNMYADTAHAPFVHGVASFEPLPDGIVLWTRVDVAASSPVSVDWEIAGDSALSNVLASGTVQTDSIKDWTVAVTVGGLTADTRYWYRFSYAGNASVVGRTRTAPLGANSQVKLAVASCSSIYSGFFNAYRRIGERDDLNLMVHLGDYIYDFVDPDEEIRVPTPYPSEPQNLQEWRERHKYYLLDPDLRFARQQHPWLVIWDNHDMDNDSLNRLQAIQAFLEYVPIRLPDSNQVQNIYRTYSYGNLLDIIMMDILVHRDQDSVPGAGPSILGNTQFAWLEQTLQNSTAQWRILGSQNMMSHWSSSNLPSWFPFGNGQVFDPSSWDGYPDDRSRVLGVLSQNQINNTIVISGDAHLSQASDLCPDPFDPQVYDPQTGVGAVGVEFLPTSISRGNLDEMGFGGFLATVAQAASMSGNPHHVYSEFTEHGYGILDIRPDSASAQYWYCPILSQGNSQNMAAELVVRDGENHWSRGPATALQQDLGRIMGLKISPNPNRGTVRVQLQADRSETCRMYLIDQLGKQILPAKELDLQKGRLLDFSIEIPRKTPAGLLFLLIEGEKGLAVKKLLYQP